MGESLVPDVLVATRLVLGLIFVGAAVAKARALPKTREFLSRLGLPAWSLSGASFSVVAVEATTGIALLAGLTLAGGSAAAALFAVFLGVLVIADKRAVPCACLGGRGGDSPTPVKLAWRALGLAGGVAVAAFGEQAAGFPSLVALALAAAAAAAVPLTSPEMRLALAGTWSSRTRRGVRPSADANGALVSGTLEPASDVRRRFLKSAGLATAATIAVPFTAFGRSLGIGPCYPACPSGTYCWCSDTGQCYCTPRSPVPSEPPPTPDVVTEAERIAGCIAVCESALVCASQDCYCMSDLCTEAFAIGLLPAIQAGPWGIRLHAGDTLNCVWDVQHCINVAAAEATQCEKDCLDLDPARSERRVSYFAAGGAAKWETLPDLADRIGVEEGTEVGRAWLVRQLDMQVFLPVTMLNALVEHAPKIPAAEGAALWLLLHEVAGERAAEMVERSATAERHPAEAARNAALLKRITAAAEGRVDSLSRDDRKAGESILRAARRTGIKKRRAQQGQACCGRQAERMAASPIVVPALVGGVS